MAHTEGRPAPFIVASPVGVADRYRRCDRFGIKRSLSARFSSCGCTGASTHCIKDLIVTLSDECERKRTFCKPIAIKPFFHLLTYLRVLKCGTTFLPDCCNCCLFLPVAIAVCFCLSVCIRLVCLSLSFLSQFLNSRTRPTFLQNTHGRTRISHSTVIRYRGIFAGRQ